MVAPDPPSGECFYTSQLCDFPHFKISGVRRFHPRCHSGGYSNQSGLQINPANLALQANFTTVFDVLYHPNVSGFVSHSGSRQRPGSIY